MRFADSVVPFAAIGVFWLCCAAMAGQTMQFNVNPDENFRISLGDSVAAILKDPRTDPSARIIPEKNGFTVLGDHIRKEFALFEDRLEYTFDFSLPAPSSHALSVLLPLPKGAQATVWHGRTHPAPPQKIVCIGGKLPEGKDHHYDEGGPTPPAVAGQGAFFPVRYIVIDGPGRAFSVDTHPAGACSEDPSYAESPLRISSCRQTDAGMEIVLSIPGGYVGFPARLKGKLIFYADARPFEQVHPFAYASEYGTLEKCLSLDFTNRPQQRKSDPTVTGTEPYRGETKYGWVSDTASLKIVATSLQALIHGAFVTSTQPARFRIDAPPGYYYLTLNFGNADGPSGLFRVKVNGEERLNRFELAPGRFKNVPLLVKTTSSTIEIALEGINGGSWVLNGLTLEPLGTLNEDFIFTRPWWHFEDRAKLR